MTPDCIRVGCIYLYSYAYYSSPSPTWRLGGRGAVGATVSGQSPALPDPLLLVDGDLTPS